MFRKFTSERVRKAHRQRLIVLGSIYVLLIVSLLLALWQLSYASFFRIDTISVSGAKAITSEDVFSLVSPYLSGAYGHLFSKRNVWLYPRRAIKEDIVETFTRVKSATLAVENTHTLRITIEEREPRALVCRKGTGDAESTACYFLDADGLIFADAPQLAGHSYIAYSADLVSKPIGAVFLTKQGFANVHAFIVSFEKLSLAPHDVIVQPDSFEIIVRAGSHDVHILVSDSISYEETLRNLDAILHEKDFSIDLVSEIDLRFGNKVFFKERSDADVDSEFTPSGESSELRPL
jgi:hypothetical protein